MSDTTAKTSPTLPEVGALAPDFTLPDAAGAPHRLSEQAPQNVVLYFYPKDATPGCTVEAQDFSRLAAEFAAANTRVFGISKDSVASHAKFSAKHDLHITLLSDAEATVCEDYGTWGEKKNYGKTYMGITRTTFLIDAEGRVARVWPKVKVAGHAEEVLRATTEI